MAEIMCNGIECDGATRPATEPHGCPYASEISDCHDDDYCTCCDECVQACCWEI